MLKIEQWLDNKLYQNIAVWVFLVLIFTVVIQAENRFLSSIGIVIFLLFPVYINNLLILPFFTKRKFIVGLLLFVLNASFFAIIGTYMISFFGQAFKWEMVVNLLGSMILALLFASAIKLAKDNVVRRQQIKDAELQLLKAQLNPHFLFNTLNNLYGMSVLKSNRLPNLMLKLSDLLRYSLYDTKEALVPLQKELNYLDNYIALERIRLEDQTEITMHIHGATDGLMIAPMLLIVFVENAFKHLETSIHGVNNVTIGIKIIDNRLDFTCVNSKNDTIQLEENLESGRSGIGLVNAKKRLLLIYPDKHILTISSDKEVYSVDLKMTL